MPHESETGKKAIAGATSGALPAWWSQIPDNVKDFIKGTVTTQPYRVIPEDVRKAFGPGPLSMLFGHFAGDDDDHKEKPHAEKPKERTSIEEWERRFQRELESLASPATSNPYFAARAEFTAMPKPGWAGVPRGINAAEVAAQKGVDDYTVSPTGKILYANDVIYDPNAAAGSQILVPPWKAVAGSQEWLLKIQDEWSDKEANAWRKRLAKQGYQVAESGGMAHDLITALSEFHANRYANFGKVQPLVPTGKAARESLRESIDFKALKEEVKTWGQVPFGEDLDDDEADYFSERMVRKMVDLSRKHPNWTGEQIQAGAKMRVQKQFSEQPQVKALIKEQEDQEVSYKIRDSILGVSQLLSA